MKYRSLASATALGIITLTACSPSQKPGARHLVLSSDLSFERIGSAAAVEIPRQEPAVPDSIRWLADAGILEVSGLWKTGTETHLSRVELDKAPWLDPVKHPVAFEMRDAASREQIFFHGSIPLEKLGTVHGRYMIWEPAILPRGGYRWTLRIPVEPTVHPRRVNRMELHFQPFIKHEPGVHEIMVSGETRKALLLSPGTVVSYPFTSRLPMELTAGISGVPATAGMGSVVIEYVHDNEIETLVSFAARGEFWHDITVPVPGTDTESTIRFRCSDAPILIGSPVLHRPKHIDSPRPDRPNVLLISLDTVRKDGISMGHMPRITAFTKRCVSFQRAVSQAPVTETSHHSIFTGLYVSKHGASGRRRISESIPNLSTLLARKGYRTAAFTDGVLVSAALGFAHGFERYWEYLGHLKDKNHLPGNLSYAREWIRDVNPTAPWFMFLHTYQAHGPYLDRSERPARMIEIKSNSEDEPYEGSIIPLNTGYDGGDGGLIGLARSAYESELRYLDAHIGAFLDSLDIAGQLEQTMVVILSDHGEGFAEHGLVGHNNSLYQELLHIPLYIRFPDDRWKGTEISTLVQSVDILPTILDHAGVDHPEDLDGRSLLPLCAGSTPRNTPAFSEFHASYSIVHWPHKMIVSRRGGGIRLFDLVKDPEERMNIYALCDEKIFNSLRSALITSLSGCITGMLVTVNRPLNPESALQLFTGKDEDVEILFDGDGDWSQRKRGVISFHPRESRQGAVVAVVKNATRITVGLGGEQHVLPEGVSHVGPYEIGIRRCTGPRRIQSPPNLPLGRDLTERLTILGYTK